LRIDALDFDFSLTALRSKEASRVSRIDYRSSSQF